MIHVPDTNVLLRFALRSDPQHLIVLSAIKKLKSDDNEVRILPQNCIEFWNVATRPASGNGFGFTVDKANHSLGLVEEIFPMLPEDARIFERWRKLVVDFGVSGVQVHDARIVAAMLVHQVTNILTFNIADFERYSKIGIRAISPLNI